MENIACMRLEKKEATQATGKPDVQLLAQLRAHLERSCYTTSREERNPNVDALRSSLKLIL
jgi:hypothetical protein